jgi:hypothetical protein
MLRGFYANEICLSKFTTMKAMTVSTTRVAQPAFRQQSLAAIIKNWINKNEATWEYNRLGISAVGIFIQVTFAAAMIVILPMANASPWAYGTGVFLAFMANSIAFAQAPIRWVLGIFAASIVINLVLSLVYIVPLLG